MEDSISIPPDDFITPMNRLLSIDGGGIKAFVSIAILTRIEKILAERYAHLYPNGEEGFRLAHYFNFIGGTSAGSILAAYLATGWSMKRIAEEFEISATNMFKNAPVFRAHQWRYKREALAKQLKHHFSRSPGSPILMGDPEVQTLLMIVALNASTCSHWPIFNNPEAKYSGLGPNNRSNLRYPLWQVIRSSTAAPTFFPPELFPSTTGGHEFIDGGVSSLNNPSFQMFLQATLPQYHVQMAKGLDRMLLVSVGTGQGKTNFPPGAVEEMYLVESARLALQSLMESSAVLQDVFCRERGYYANSQKQAVDGELGDLDKRPVKSDPGDLGSSKGDFVYLRYNPFLMEDGAKVNPSSGEKAKHIHLDSLEQIDYLKKAGSDYAQAGIAAEDFPGGALFPNAKDDSPRSRLNVVRDSGGKPVRYRLQRFEEEENGTKRTLDIDRESCLPPLSPPRRARQPQSERLWTGFVLSLLWTGALIGVSAIHPDWPQRAATYFFGAEPQPAALVSDLLSRLLWLPIALATSLFFLGILINHAKVEKRTSGIVISSVIIAFAWFYSYSTGLELYRGLEKLNADSLGPVHGIIWCLLVALAVGSMASSAVLFFYRRWIAGIPIASCLLLFLALAEIPQLTSKPHFGHLMLLFGLTFAFAGVHLIWWGRQARVVLLRRVWRTVSVPRARRQKAGP